jgi:hypothetical protein
VPELKLLPAYAAERAFLRGAAAAEGGHVLICHASRRPALGPVGWALRRLDEGSDDAVIARGHWIAARRHACFGVLARAGGRGEAFERRFEREAAGLRLTVAGSARGTGAPASWLEPVLRLLSA